jgi:hypothetical protein
MMRVAAGNEAFLDDDLRRLEAGIEIAVAPLLGRLAQGQPVVARGGEIAGLPLDGLQVDLRRRDVAIRPRVGAAGEQAKSMRIASIASAAISSDSAATARIGSPT